MASSTHLEDGRELCLELLALPLSLGTLDVDSHLQRIHFRLHLISLPCQGIEKDRTS